jgi:hypothetical protein
MGTAFAQGVGRKLEEAGYVRPKIIVPLMYGDRQKRILLEENPQDPNLIYFDEEYGEILKQIMFGDGDFSQHLRQVNDHYDGVQKALNNRFTNDSGNFDSRSLVSGEVQQFSTRSIIATIDTSPRVGIDAPNRYFAFPILLSEILKAAQDEGLGFDDTQLGNLVKRMLKVESAYSQIFIPYINPLSYQYASDLSAQPEEVNGNKIVYTPAMKSKHLRTKDAIAEPGIYVMFSGTGSAKETISHLADSAHRSGLDVYTPPWVEVDGAIKMTPDILSDLNIRAVISRSGWGTGWQVQNYALPWIVTPYESGDDPEIYFNNKTVDALRMGKILSEGDTTTEKLEEIIQNLSVGVQGINMTIERKFGTLDGVDFVSSAIAKDYISNLSSS